MKILQRLILFVNALINLENVFRFLCEHEEIIGVFFVFESKIITSTRVKKKAEYEYDALKTFRRFKNLGTIGNTFHINKEMLDLHLSFLGNIAKKQNDSNE